MNRVTPLMYIWAKIPALMEGKYIFKNFVIESDLMSFLNDEKILPTQVVSIMLNSANLRFYLVYFKHNSD